MKEPNKEMSRMKITLEVSKNQEASLCCRILWTCKMVFCRKFIIHHNPMDQKQNTLSQKNQFHIQVRQKNYLDTTDLLLLSGKRRSDLMTQRK